MDSALDSTNSVLKQNEISKLTSVSELGALTPKGFESVPEHWGIEAGLVPWGDHDESRFVIILTKKASAKASLLRTLVVVHGFGEHSGRYLHFPSELEKVGSNLDCIVLYDQLGHGRSPGIRGHVEAFDHFSLDLARIADQVQKYFAARNQAIEWHLLGHSMGGHVVLRHVLLDQPTLWKSISVSSPFLAVKAKVPAIKKIAAWGLARVWGNLQIDTGMNVLHLSHEQAVTEAYKMDQLVHSKMTSQFYRSMTEAMADTLMRVGVNQANAELSIQFQIPLSDPIVDSDVSLKFFKRYKNSKKRLQTYPDFFHEPFNEIERKRAFFDLSEWIIRS